jgi:hypothetical protein
MESDEIQKASVADEEMHAAHVELCSPFCFCACCKTVSYPVFNIDMNIPSPEVAFSVPTEDQRYFSFPEIIWHPPKV